MCAAYTASTHNLILYDITGAFASPWMQRKSISPGGAKMLDRARAVLGTFASGTATLYLAHAGFSATRTNRN
jgi:hypothetical protein